MVHAGVSELRRGFRQHRLNEETPAPSRYLLMFYAVECGLKAAYLRRNSYSSTNQISGLSEKGHDLMTWIKELRLPAYLAQRSTGLQLRRGGSSIRVSDAHQAWRYGVEIRSDDEKQTAEWLKRLWSWADEELRL